MGDIERLVAGADDGTVDEAFLQHLYKGGELLSAGKVAEAKDVLEKAYKLQPKNQKGQNLLGLAYFKLSMFDRAAEIYELLVRENPVDPTLRVNLGLVYLKQNLLQRAIREFETSCDLAPDYKKAQNYLGLAYAQAGDYSRAKDCFVAAGSVTMAEKMERALKDPSRAPQMPLDKPSAPPAAAEAKPAPQAAEPAEEPAAEARPAAEPSREEEVEIEVDDDDLQDASALSTSAEPAAEKASEAAAAAPSEPVPATEATPESAAITAPAIEERPVAVAAPAAQPEAAPVAPVAEEVRPVAAPPRSISAVPALVDLTRSLAVSPPSGNGPFEVASDAVVVRIGGEVLTRLDGLIAAQGALTYKPEMKRFRGRATDKAFGDSERRVVRVSGSGALIVAPRGRLFVPVELNDESAYFQEDAVFAFEESVIFENGRVPSKIAPDLHLVHLRGKGKVLLCVPAPLRSVEVLTAQSPCSVPLSVLVGWHGSLTPRIMPLIQDQESSSSVAAVELAGQGFAILCNLKAPN